MMISTLTETLWSDARQAIRRLLKTPAVTLSLVGTIALAMLPIVFFDAVRTVVFPFLPFDRADQLVVVSRINELNNLRPSSYPKHTFLREHLNTMDLAAWASIELTLATSGGNATLQVEAVTDNYFDVLRLPPQIGRVIDSRDVHEQAPVVVLSHRLWKTHFGESPEALGKVVSLNGQPFTVIGVMGPEFDGLRKALYSHALPAPIDAWIPVVLAGRGMPAKVAMALLTRPHDSWLVSFARLRESRTLAEARADLARVNLLGEKAWPTDDPASDNVFFVKPMAEAHADIKLLGQLNLLRIASSLLLLLAFSNVIGIMLVRNVDRSAETALKVALGAPATVLFRLDVLEAFFVGLAGSTAAVVLTWFAIHSLLGVGSGAELEIAGVTLRRSALHLGAVAVGQGLAIGLGGSLLAGALAALRTMRVDIGILIKGGGERSARTGLGALKPTRLRGALAVVQVALAITLVLPAGLMFRSLSGLLTADHGFRPDGVVGVPVGLPGSQTIDPVPLMNDALSTVRVARGVDEAAFATCLPLSQRCPSSQIVLQSATGKTAEATVNVVSPRYFAALRVPLLRGRDFDERDTGSAPPVVIVSQGLVARLGEDLVGQRCTIGGFVKYGAIAEIVGVVGDVRYDDPVAPLKPAVYVPFAQVPTDGAFLVRSRDVGRASDALRLLRPTLTKGKAGEGTIDLSASSRESLAPLRVAAWIIAVAALVSIALATSGVHGVVAWTVARSRAELGIRALLGASPRDLYRSVVLTALRLTASGLVLGLALGVVASHKMQHLVVGVSTWDRLVMIIALATALMIAMAAAFVPARRAAAADPAAMVRSQ